MQTIRFRKISFKSYALLNVFMGISIGLFIGIFMFIIALLNGEMTVNDEQVTGYGAKIFTGVIILVLAPIWTAVMGFFFSLFSYLPFNHLILRTFKGVTIAGEESRMATPPSHTPDTPE